MRLIPRTIALTLLMAGPTLAQTVPATSTPGMASPQTTSPTAMPPAASAATPTNPATPPAPSTPPTADNAATGSPPKPTAWKGSDADWAAHIRNCGMRNGYDPTTDKYRTASGQMRACPR